MALGRSVSPGLRVLVCAVMAALLCAPAQAELRAFIIHGGDTPSADLGWISAICQTFKALTKFVAPSRVVLYTKAQPKQIDHACKFGIENQTLSTEYEWTKQDVLDALRFYSYNHNVMLFLFGHGHLPEEKATLRSRVLWTDRVSWDEARTFNVSLAGAHPEHVQLIRRSSPQELKRQGLEFFEYSRAKFKTVLAARATDLMASHGPAHRSPGFLETQKELEFADTAPNIGALTVYPSEKRAGVPDVVGPNDRLIRGADIIALGQPWYFLTVIAYHDYSGGMFDIFKQHMVKNKIVLFSPTLPYTPTDFVISTDQNVRLLGRLFEARDQDMSLLQVFKNYLMGCKAAWTDTGARLDPKYPIRRCTAHPPVLKQFIVRDPLSHNVKVSFERENAALLSTTPVATVLRDFPTQAVTINLRRSVGGKWHSLIVQPSWSLADFKAAAAAALDFSAYAKGLVSNNYGVSGPKFGLNCFVTGTDGRAVAVNVLILKSMRNKSVVTCTLPFTPNISPPADTLTPFSVTA